MFKRLFCCEPRAPPEGNEEILGRLGVRKGCRLLAHGDSVQHPMKKLRHCTNADAFFISEYMIGVADGVSAVEGEGVDASFLPKELMNRCRELGDLRKRDQASYDRQIQGLCNEFDPDGLPLLVDEWPRHLLRQAWCGCTSMGATTALVVAVEEDGLAASMIGDSAFLHLRRPQGRSSLWEILYRSQPKLHYFNCPFQLTRMPDIDLAIPGLWKQADLLDCLPRTSAEVGDIIIAGSDGIFDNMFDQEILDIVNDHCVKGFGPNGAPLGCPPSKLVDELLQMAVSNATPQVNGRQRKTTPFSAAAQQKLGKTFYGGKPDDTTVVVAYVVSEYEPLNVGLRSTEFWEPDSHLDERTDAGLSLGLDEGVGGSSL